MPHPQLPFSRRFALLRSRHVLVLAAALACVALLAPRQARAAADVRKMNLVLSGVPTQFNAGDLNDAIDYYNITQVRPRGYEDIKKFAFSWMFDADLRYFVRPNVAISAGVSHLRISSGHEYLPALSQAVDVRFDALAVPIHLGAAYYATPLNQGDFSARMFVGGGMLQYIYTRGTFEQVLTRPDSATAAQLGGTQKLVIAQDGPGYYAEGGVQMWFASRYGVLLSVLYRSGELRQVRQIGYYRGGSQQNEASGDVFANPLTGEPFKMDVGGLGARFGAVIQF